MNPVATADTLATSDVLLRLLTAFVCGAIIGLNREFRRKPAGFRTFTLVSVGSAVVVVTIGQTAGAGADAVSRVIQGVLTGIGFLGAGVILHRAPNRKLVAGLTTSAAIWLTAGLGMASGAGQYVLALLGLAFAMVLLLLGGPFERLLQRLFGIGQRPSEEEDNREDPPG
jgi:putative Mg2+ transporter-C (MgtC) family protein